MIPHGRTAVDARQAAAILGISYKHWGNRPDHFGLQPFTPGRRKPLYDQAQVEAVRDGRPLPSWPTNPHPDDLLDEQEAAEELGVEYVSLRKYRSQGRLPGWIKVCGVSHINRTVLDDIIAARATRAATRPTQPTPGEAR